MERKRHTNQAEVTENHGDECDLAYYLSSTSLPEHVIGARPGEASQ